MCLVLRPAPAQGKILLPAFQNGFLRLPSQIVPNRAPGFPQRPAEAADTDLVAQPSMAPSDPMTILLPL